MAAFRTRSLAHVEFPYAFLDATYLKGIELLGTEVLPQIRKELDQR